MEKGAITIDTCTPVDMSYYVMIRETIHGLDNLIETTIHHSVVIIAVAIGVGMSVYPVIPTPWSHFFLLITTLIAIFLTSGSHKRVKLYSDLLVEHVEVGKKLEERLLSDDNAKSTKRIEENVKYAGIKITKRIENNVKHAGRKGEAIFKRGIVAFYAIEGAIFVYLGYNLYTSYHIQLFRILDTISFLLLIILKGVVVWVAQLWG